MLINLKKYGIKIWRHKNVEVKTKFGNTIHIRGWNPYSKYNSKFGHIKDRRARSQWTNLGTSRSQWTECWIPGPSGLIQSLRCKIPDYIPVTELQNSGTGFSGHWVAKFRYRIFRSLRCKIPDHPVGAYISRPHSNSSTSYLKRDTETKFLPMGEKGKCCVVT